MVNLALQFHFGKELVLELSQLGRHITIGVLKRYVKSQQNLRTTSREKRIEKGKSMT